MKTRFLRAALAPLLLAMSGAVSHASGTLKLETSAVIVDTDDQEQTLGVRNDADTALLMVARLKPVPEDKADLLTVTPPLARIEPGETQVVRFILKPRAKDAAPLKTEHYARASFLGVPPRVKNKVNVAIRQEVSVIVHPGGLSTEDEPWKLLKWRRDAGGLVVTNPSPYVVRFAYEATTLPSQTTGSMPRTYILPGESVQVNLKAAATDDKVRLLPASLYGYVGDPYVAPLEAPAIAADTSKARP